MPDTPPTSAAPRCPRCGREASAKVLICGSHGVCLDCEDHEGLPPGFIPAWTFIKTQEGVVEYEHEAGAAVRQATQPECQCRNQTWSKPGDEEHLPSCPLRTTDE